MTPRIVPRNEWQIEYNPTWPQWRHRRQPFIVPAADRKGLVVHCNGPDMTYGTEAAEVRAALAVARWHWQNNKWSDGAYSYLVGNLTGNAYELRGLRWDQFANGDDQVGQNDGDDVEWYTAMWMGGNYQPVSDAAYEGMALVLSTVRDAGSGKRCLPHNDFRVKACPGPSFTQWARDHDNRDLEADMAVPFPDDWHRWFNDQPRNGDPDFIVQDIEARLGRLGYPLHVDGRKGVKTLAAVEQFKADHMGAESPNANLGAKAWAKLRELTDEPSAAPAPSFPGKDALIRSLTDQASAALDDARAAVDAIAGTVQN